MNDMNIEPAEKQRQLEQYKQKVILGELMEVTLESEQNLIEYLKMRKDQKIMFKPYNFQQVYLKYKNLQWFMIDGYVKI